MITTAIFKITIKKKYRNINPPNHVPVKRKSNPAFQ